MTGDPADGNGQTEQGAPCAEEGTDAPDPAQPRCRLRSDGDLPAEDHAGDDQHSAQHDGRRRKEREAHGTGGGPELACFDAGDHRQDLLGPSLGGRDLLKGLTGDHAGGVTGDLADRNLCLLLDSGCGADGLSDQLV